MTTHGLLCLTCLATLPWAASAAPWDAAAATAVVFNTDFPESESLARFYAEKRGIPPARIIGLPCSTEEAISRQAFNESLQAPLSRLIDRGVDIIVLMHGVPSKITRQKEKPQPSREDEASVDSELTCLRMPSLELPGAITNPWYDKPQRFHDFQEKKGMLLVARLDAASPATVRRMIEDSLAVEKTGLRGRAVIDLALKKGAYEEGEEWLRRSALSYKTYGIPTYVDRYEPVIRDGWPLPDTALYFGWYTGEVAGALKSPSFRFKRGAVACHLHSFSAGIIRTGTQNWVGPLLEHGAAATMGNVWEPYLSLTVHFDIFNDRLLKGWTLAEAAWCATPALSWMNVVMGDPLYRPFAASALGIDRDYAVYQGIAERHAEDDDSSLMKREVLEYARSRNNPHLLEMLALLGSQESKTTEAIDLLQHARSLYAKAEDRLRTLIYEVELLRRDGDARKDKQALALLRRMAQDESLKPLKDFLLVTELVKELGG